MRAECARRLHGEWTLRPAAAAIEDLEKIEASRIPELVPVRHARMLASSFAFFRGTPSMMARDLATTPTSGLTCQIGGDAHLGNFGLFATPEGRVVFDVNDFDETLPGPFEWDVKRLAVSIVLAMRTRTHLVSEARRAVILAGRSYRRTMLSLADKGILETWRGDASLANEVQNWDREGRKLAMRALRKARSKNSALALGELTRVDGATRRMAFHPLVLVPLDEARQELGGALDLQEIVEALRRYRGGLPEGIARELGRYRVVDACFKVVGVGSVALHAYAVILEGNGPTDPLVLQLKEARASVLEPYLGRSAHPTHGDRVVIGQHRMQAASDALLGATRIGRRDFYVRQLWDRKGHFDVRRASPRVIADIGELCGERLARAHARTGDAVTFAGYLGRGGSLDEALGEFAIAYAKQVDRDFRAFQDAVASGRLAVVSTD